MDKPENIEVTCDDCHKKYITGKDIDGNTQLCCPHCNLSTPINYGNIDQTRMACKLMKKSIEQLQAQLDALQWRPVEEGLPEDLKRVNITFELDNGKRWRTVAEHVGYRTVLMEDYIDDTCDDFFDYDEEADIYYAPEGWYEANIEPEMNYHLSGKITHWMPIPPLPEKGKK